MKKQILKNYFIAILSLAFLLLINCRDEAIDSEEVHNHSGISNSKKYVKYSDFVQNTNFNFSELQSELNVNNITALDSAVTNNFIVNIEDILVTVNKNNQSTAYSFYLASKHQENNSFYNLVFLKKKTGDWVYRVLKYTPTSNNTTNIFKGNVEELYSSEKKTNNKITCYYQIITSEGTCSAGHKTLSDCGGNVNCCINCWVTYTSTMLQCDAEGFEYPSDGGGFGINDGSGSSNMSGLVFALDANYRTKLNSLSQEIRTFLIQNYETHYNVDFSNWSIDFFYNNPTITIQEFQSWFLNSEVDNDILDEVKLYIVTNNYTIPSYTVSNYPGKDDGMPFEWWKDNNWMKNNIRIDGNKPNEEPNSTELMLFSAFPLQASFHVKNSNNALAVANQLVASGKYTHIHNGKADAFRHTFWNALDSSDFGKKITLLFTTAHEVGSTNHPLETQMDIHNNEQGAQLGTNYSTFTSATTIKDAVITMMDSTSNIWYLSPLADHDGNNILTTTQIIPTN